VLLSNAYVSTEVECCTNLRQLFGLLLATEVRYLAQAPPCALLVPATIRVWRYRLSNNSTQGSHGLVAVPMLYRVLTQVFSC
jgi:hypothetical protein